MVRSSVVFFAVLLGVALHGSAEQWLEDASFHENVLRRHRRSLDWNVIVDNLLVQARENIIAEGKDELPIPDIDERFEKRFGFIKATGKFEARNGRVRSLASIRRTGQVGFTGIPGKSVTLTAHLGFGELFVHYNDYKAKIWNIGPRGHISAKVGGNSVRIRLRLDVKETTCKITLEEATVLDVSGFNVKVTGLGPLNWLTSRIVTWVAQKRRGDIMQNLERALRRGLDRAIGKFNCDKYINDIRGFT